MLVHGYSPEQMKTSVIIPIPLPGIIVRFLTIIQTKLYVMNCVVIILKNGVIQGSIMNY